jgi:lipopolysaccharide transport system permease protein
MTAPIAKSGAIQTASGAEPVRAVYEWGAKRRRRDPLELWHRRDLLYRFVWKEFTVRYKQTAIGVLWVILQPLAFASLFAGVILRGSATSFGLARGSDFVPLYLGMSIWLMVSSIVLNGSSALLTNQAVLAKVYFPRQIPVLAATILSFVDFLFAVSLVPFFALLTHTPLSIVGFVASIGCAAVLALIAHGLALALAAAVVRFRDVRIIVPYFINLLFFFSAALFPFAFYSERWRSWVLSNPVAATVDFSRHLSLGLPLSVDTASVLRGLYISIATMVIGVIAFRRSKRQLVEQL